MSLYERITEALNGTTPGPWTEWANCDGNGVDILGPYFKDVPSTRPVVCKSVQGRPDARLIAEAPGLLAEAAQRLTPHGYDVESVVAGLRIIAGELDSRGTVTALQRAADCLSAADLLAQAFLEETE